VRGWRDRDDALKHLREDRDREEQRDAKAGREAKAGSQA
jgi:hypothetical protein